MIPLKKTVVIPMLALFALLFSVVGVHAADKTFTLAVLGPFTGPAAQVGTNMKNAVELAFSEIDNKIEGALLWSLWHLFCHPLCLYYVTRSCNGPLI